MKLSRISIGNFFSLLTSITLLMLSCGMNWLPPEPLNNLPPSASAGPDKSVFINEANAITLDGSGSSDPEQDPLTYQWELIFMLQSENGQLVEKQVAAVFEPGEQSGEYIVSPRDSVYFEPGVYYFMLTVDDGYKRSAPDIMRIDVRKPDAWVGNAGDVVLDIVKVASIQEAIDSVDNSVIRYIAVDYGTYNEIVHIRPRINLIGLSVPDVQHNNQPVIASVLAAEEESLVQLDEDAAIENMRLQVLENPALAATTVSAVKITAAGAAVRLCTICSPLRDVPVYSDGIKIENGCSALVKNCVINRVSGEGIEVAGSGSLELEDSLIRSTSGSALYGYGSTLVRVTNSVIYRGGWHGIHVENCSSVIIEHTTFADNAVDGYSGPGNHHSNLLVSGCETVIVKSSLYRLANIPVYGVYLENPAPLLTLDFRYNCLCSLQDTPLFYGGEFPAAQAAAANYTINGGAGLVNPEQNDFNPAAGSPAIGKGENGTNAGINKPLTFNY